MKIIGTDNFAREHVSDFLVAENLNEYYAELIARLLNARGEHGTFYNAVADDHELYKWEP